MRISPRALQDGFVGSDEVCCYRSCSLSQKRKINICKFRQGKQYKLNKGQSSTRTNSISNRFITKSLPIHEQQHFLIYKKLIMFHTKGFRMFQLHFNTIATFSLLIDTMWRTSQAFRNIKIYTLNPFVNQLRMKRI